MIGISGSMFWSKPWWKWYLTPVVNFSDVRRSQLAKSTLSPTSWFPWDLFRAFKVYSNSKEKQQESTAPIQSPVKLQPWFLRLLWKTCLRQNCSLRSLGIVVKDLPFFRTLWWWKSKYFCRTKNKLVYSLTFDNYYSRFSCKGHAVTLSTWNLIFCKFLRRYL